MHQTFVAGDTLDFLTTVASYPPSDGWTLQLRLMPFVDGLEPIDLTATTDGDDYRVQVGPDVTADYAAGNYTLMRWVEKTGARHVVEGEPALPDTITIQPDPATATSYDGRSSARKALEQAEAARVTFLASNGLIKEYEIGNRRTVYRDVSQIQADIDKLRLEVAKEDDKAREANGMRSRRYVYARFGRG